MNHDFNERRRTTHHHIYAFVEKYAELDRQVGALALSRAKKTIIKGMENFNVDLKHVFTSAL